MNHTRRLRDMAYTHIIPIFIGLVYLVLAVSSTKYDDVTYDEGPHYLYGVKVLQRSPFREEATGRLRSTMPVTALNTIPRVVEQTFHPGLKKIDNGITDIKNGRYITILVSLLLLLYCYQYALLISSSKTACIVLLLVALDPNILAHARLVTTDMYATISFVAVIYHLVKWLIYGQHQHFFYFSIAIAIAQCCKVNCILLYPAVSVPILWVIMEKRHKISLKNILMALLFFSGVQVLIINTAFLFAGHWYSLDELPLKSNFFINLQRHWFSSVILPFPDAYCTAFDLVQFEREHFDGTPLNYLNGTLRFKSGFWNYYFYCYGLKTPLLTLLITISGFIFCAIKRPFRSNWLLICVWPCLFLLFILSTSSIQNGYRYLLPVFCMLVIYAAPFLQWMLTKTAVIVFPAVVVVALASCVTVFPNYLVFTNRLIWHKENAYRYFADSNLNWGQRVSYLRTFLKLHPSYKYEPDNVQHGYIVVDINHLTGITEPAKFEWLRLGYTPIATIEGCYLIYQIP